MNSSSKTPLMLNGKIFHLKKKQRMRNSMNSELNTPSLEDDARSAGLDKKRMLRNPSENDIKQKIAAKLSAIVRLINMIDSLTSD